MASDVAGEFAGLYSDGATAAARRVTVRFRDEALEISGEDGSILVVWSFGALVSSGPLERGEPANLGNRALPDARLFIDSPQFVDQLLAAAPHLTRGAERVRVLLPLIAALAVIAALIGAVWASGWSPAASIANLIPDTMRRMMGEHVVRFMTTGKPACTAGGGGAALDKLVLRLNEGTDGSDHFSVIVADVGMVNAFAAPGERIVVSRQLIDFVHSPEELAGIIAHEMGHGILRHPETGLVRSMGISAIITLFSGGDAGQLGNLGSLLLQFSYTREAERQADRQALTIMRRAELPAEPFAEFFDRLRKTEGDWSGGVIDIFSTHPSLPERIDTVKGQPSYPHRTLLSGEEWQQLRSICK